MKAKSDREGNKPLLFQEPVRVTVSVTVLLSVSQTLLFLIIAGREQLKETAEDPF